MTRVALLLAAIAGCGRLGFDSVAPIVDAPPVTLDAPAVVCGAAYQPAPGTTSRYRFTGLQTWNAAEADCETDGGHLVVIDAPAEESLVRTLIDAQPTLEPTWIGLTDTVVNGTFGWVTGAPLGYDGFKNGEPTESNQVEDCVLIRVDGNYWDDRTCNAIVGAGLCECDGVPASPSAFCDTDGDATCGDCATDCVGEAICTAQRCMFPL